MDGEETVKENNDAEYNIFRDSTIRYLGYANEIGESFRYQYPRMVIPSYAVAFGYCFMDSVTAGYYAWAAHDVTEREQRTNLIPQSREMKTILTMGDTLLWQTLASVTIPGVAINLIVKTSRMVVPRLPGLPGFAVKWLPTAIGLSSIPFIVQPIDRSVDYILDSTVREWWMK
mmetsp:Transcript_5435/g.7865  ORF Transcript_5435/g.7865 Transcript_5435/m.7865 type:complete len:173 (-) Transcript_5435:65-583(-)